LNPFVDNNALVVFLLAKKFAVKAINLIRKLKVHNPMTFNTLPIWKFPLQ